MSSSRVDDNSTAVMASLFRELEAAPLANGAVVPPSVTALLQQTQRMKGQNTQRTAAYARAHVRASA